MDENSSSSQEEISEPKKESLLDKIKINLPDFSNSIRTFLIPGAIVVIVLLVAGGGTFLVASNFFQGPTASKDNSTRISESDIPVVATVPIPTPTPRPPTPTPTSMETPEDIVATPTPNPATNWIAYSFTAVSLNFEYPPGWNINTPGTSAAPYLYVQNFTGTVSILSPNPGQYAIYIGRFPQVGITTVSGLTTQLAINDTSSTNLAGANLGVPTVVSSTSTTVNGYQALERTVTYPNYSGQSYELYVLDGVSNVIEFKPLFNQAFGQSYFNTLISTISFTNSPGE